MKWLMIGGVVLFLVVYFGAVPIYQAMKSHDYNNMYYGIQDAKRASGSRVDDRQKRFMSYSERYARGLPTE